MHRRQFLAGTIAAGVGAFAGCSAAAAVPPPQVSKQLLDEGGWEQTTDESSVVFERSMAGMTLTATQHTRQYSDTALRAAIKDRTLGNVDTDLNVFFATRVDFNPNIDNLPAGVGRAEIMNIIAQNAKQGFRDQLEAAGLENVEETGSGSLTVDTGEEADLTTFAADFPFEGIALQVTPDKAVRVPGTAIGIEGRMATWHHGDFALIAGGANPAENYAETIEQSLSDGIDVTVDIDMKLAPRRYATEVTNLIKSVR